MLGVGTSLSHHEPQYKLTLQQVLWFSRSNALKIGTQTNEGRHISMQAVRQMIPVPMT